MRNLEIASVFNQIADLLEIQGANPFRIRAYRRAAMNIEGFADNIETVALSGTLRNIPGIGEVPSVGPKTAKQIYDKFRIQSIEELEELCKTGKLLGVPGFKQKTVDNILKGIDVYRRRRGNYLLGRTTPIAAQLCKYLESHVDRVA